MIRIEHIAMWVNDIDRICEFYSRYFGAGIGKRYENPAKGFASRFLTFASGARMEVMSTTMLSPVPHEAGAQRMGLTHLALSLSSQQAVDDKTAQLKAEGVTVLDGPRRTGDGYYESVVLDPEGNRIELMA
ncbi:MAG TPA: VOC family protein [Steroidobacteraceae bacterium]|nr:VOC family protein [Steroidobacteraceae bacterium]